MSLTIPLTPAEEARLSAAARRIGLAPEELMKRLTLEHLPAAAEDEEGSIDATLRRWQQEDGAPLLPDVPTLALFAQWAEEDARMTSEERAAEDRLWAEIENGLMESSGLRLRRPG